MLCPSAEPSIAVNTSGALLYLKQLSLYFCPVLCFCLSYFEAANALNLPLYLSLFSNAYYKWKKYLWCRTLKHACLCRHTMRVGRQANSTAPDASLLLLWAIWASVLNICGQHASSQQRNAVLSSGSHWSSLIQDRKAKNSLDSAVATFPSLTDVSNDVLVPISLFPLSAICPTSSLLVIRSKFCIIIGSEFILGQ